MTQREETVSCLGTIRAAALFLRSQSVSFLPSFCLPSLGNRAATRQNLSILSVAMVLYGINRWSDFFSLLPGLEQLFRYHFNDFLGAIVFAAYVNLLCLFHKVRPLNKYRSLLLLGILCSLFWEGLAPLILPYSTRDWLDCAAYFLGMTVYWLLLRASCCFRRS